MGRISPIRGLKPPAFDRSAKRGQKISRNKLEILRVGQQSPEASTTYQPSSMERPESGAEEGRGNRCSEHYEGMKGFQNKRPMCRLVVKADPPNRSCPDRCQRGEVPTEGYRRNREGEGTET